MCSKQKSFQTDKAFRTFAHLASPRENGSPVHGPEGSNLWHCPLDRCLRCELDTSIVKLI